MTPKLKNIALKKIFLLKNHKKNRNMPISIEKARLKYKPKKIKYLLIAETPPKSNSNRYFYYENVKEKDSLFLETMIVLYPEFVSDKSIKEIR